MGKTADAVVIGAGINGASIAFNLLKKGLKKVTVLERFSIASGGTGKSAAIIRQHYSNTPLIKMMKRCIEIFSHFEDYIGGDAGFVNTGWAFLAPPGAVEGFEKNLALQQELGIKTGEINKEELLETEPRFNLDDVARIAYEPDSGYADPYLTTMSYIQATTARGGELFQGEPVTALEVERGRVCAVKTKHRTISTGVVINAGGPWADRLARMVDLDLPLQVSLEEEVLLVPPPGESPPQITVSDMAKAIYYRADSHRVLVGRGYPKEYQYVDPDCPQDGVNPDFIAETCRRMVERIPVYRDALVQHSYSGLYDITPDWHPVLGRTPVEGYYVAAGFSGHGFKLGPAIGELLAEEIVDGRAKDIDLGEFSLNRFKQGRLFAAAYGGNRA